MTYEECTAPGRAHPHNARCRYTHGFKCEDCGAFIAVGTQEYELHEGHRNPLTISMALHNRRADLINEHNKTHDSMIKEYTERMKCYDHYTWNGKDWDYE